MHQRFAPKRHRFDYCIFMLGLDLDELDAVHGKLRLLSINRANVYSFREADYLPLHEVAYNPSRESTAAAAGTSSLKERVARFLAVHGVELGGGRVELITLPRVLGYQFNPVSFYLCRDASGAPLAAIAEVTNTFRETKPYFLGQPAANGGGFHLRVPKQFYVSPYSDVDVAFDFRLHPRADRLAVQIDDYAGASRLLTSTLQGPARVLRDRTLAWFAVKYPLLTLRVIGLIHWHALRLYLKGVPWFRKAARPTDQRDLYRPHSSLTSVKPSDA